jgi:U3 small nucleolar RNA-associated protein 15
MTFLVEDATSLVIELYAEHIGQSPEIDRLINALHDAVRKSAEVAQIAWASRGMLDLLMAGS